MLSLVLRRLKAGKSEARDADEGSRRTKSTHQAFREILLRGTSAEAKRFGGSWGIAVRILRLFNVSARPTFGSYPAYDSQGRLGLALVRESAAVPVTVEPADLVDAPTLNPQGGPDTFNETFVRFTNRDKRFQEDSVAYRDRGNFQITQVVLSQTLSRLWITRQAIAQKIANAAGRVAAQPMLAGSMQVRKSKASGLTVGGLLSLSFPQSGVDANQLRNPDVRGLQA
jgi:hypothetical protein